MMCIDEFYLKEDLEKLHTKQLLNLLRSLVGCSECVECYDFEKKKFYKCAITKAYNKQIIKEILASRPHVMNKQESKEHRKMLKKKGD